MRKVYQEADVLEAAVERIEYAFDNFDAVLVSFSGGKDSGVCLNLCYDYAKETGQLDKLKMYHLDYEAQYQQTTDYVTEVFDGFPGVEKWWLCLPVEAKCACRMDGDTWTTWELEKRDIWVREYPDSPYLVSEGNCEFDCHGIDYDVQDRFNKWVASKYGKTAVVVGIRADESLNRLAAITSKQRVNLHEGIRHTKVISDEVVNFYPIYDWKVSDVWTYFGRTGHDYNKLYDLYHLAGLSIDQMRVASPFHDCGAANLKLYKVIDPNNWGKMVGRVNGANFCSMYGGTTAMGWKGIKKPDHLTWKEYCYFLLGTLDEDTRAHYMSKLETSIKFWREKGGTLEEETIRELEDGGVEFIDRGQVCKTSDKRVVSFSEYPDDLDVTNFREVPTYKRMCVCIIKNDYCCKYMGFAQTKEETSKRRKAIEKYKEMF